MGWKKKNAVRRKYFLASRVTFKFTGAGTQGNKKNLKTERLLGMFNLRGFRNTSLVDYPGKIASVIFVGGCNMGCSYCHNLPLFTEKRISKSLIDFYLRQNRNIDGIVLTGGEPTTLNGIFKL